MRLKRFIEPFFSVRRPITIVNKPENYNEALSMLALSAVTIGILAGSMSAPAEAGRKRCVFCGSQSLERSHGCRRMGQGRSIELGLQPRQTALQEGTQA